MASDDTRYATPPGRLLGADDATAAPSRPTPARIADRLPGWPRRYEDLGWIGQGGMGEVRRVRDRRLGNVLAMKILRAGLVGHPLAVRSFVHEARLTAELQHPNIVSAQDLGQLRDRRWWFTMPEVRGRTLAAVLAEWLGRAREAPEDAARGRRRVVALLEQACRGAAYAHAHGVVHRDLKPDNVMVGGFGEVFVMDWGLASRIGEAAPADAAAGARWSTNAGAVGTPGFMPPEQWAGGHKRLGPESDVWSLGAILHVLLFGAPPSPLDGVLAAIDAIRAPGDTREVVGEAGVPGRLLDLCRWCLQPEGTARPANAEVVADALRAWLEREEQTERAHAAVREADAALPEIDRLRDEAARLRATATTSARRIAAHEPVEAKAAAWSMEEDAEELEKRADIQEGAHVQTLELALRHAPDFAPALDRLADHYRTRITRAEAAGDTRAAAVHASLLAVHDRGRHAAWLRGEAAVTLVTDPPGADVFLYEWTRVRRRLELVPVRALGVTPLVEVPLPRGSYVLRATRYGYTPLDYPVQVARGEHWHGVRAGEAEADVIRMIPLGALGAADRPVAAGWFRAGGDPRAPDALPTERVWLDALVVRAHPVTHAEYLIFVNDVDPLGTDAERRVPREPPGGGGAADSLYRFRGGRWQLAPETIRPDSPVTLIDWHAAAAYASWYAERSGRPWRLLHELEREKAARGVDGRFFPWGDYLDPSWACMHKSHAGAASIVPVEAFVADVSPYGIRGLAGNTRDWCSNRYVREGASGAGDATAPLPEEEHAFRCVRGGSWVSSEDLCRAAARFAARPTDRRTGVGLRIAYSWA